MRSSRFPRYLIAATLALLACGLGLEAYIRTADRFSVTPLSLPPDTRSVVLVFHGSEDAGDPVLAEIADHFRERAQPDRQVINYDWSPASDNRLRARSNARRVGMALGEELAALPRLSSVLLISHSAGAYVPDSLCESLRSEAAQAPEVRSIYLDPFGLQGLLDLSHGARNHGRCADFALAVVNTDDPAPATNEPLQQAYTIDVTGHPGKKKIMRNGHYWPLRYFADALNRGGMPDLVRSQSELPRGQMRVDNGD